MTPSRPGTLDFLVNKRETGPTSGISEKWGQGGVQTGRWPAVLGPGQEELGPSVAGAVFQHFLVRSQEPVISAQDPGKRARAQGVRWRCCGGSSRDRQRREEWAEELKSGAGSAKASANPTRAVKLEEPPQGWQTPKQREVTFINSAPLPTDQSWDGDGCDPGQGGSLLLRETLKQGSAVSHKHPQQLGDQYCSPTGEIWRAHYNTPQQWKKMVAIHC